MNTPLKRIHVVAGVIYHPSKQQVLIARRPEHLHQGGLWEFPGGKVAQGESAQQALFRELKEELAIEVNASTPLLCTAHDYSDKPVLLDVWAVNGFDGQAQGNEGQRIKWVDISALSDYEFPAANRPALDLVLSLSSRP